MSASSRAVLLLVPVRHELREAVLPFLQDLYAAARVTVHFAFTSAAGDAGRDQATPAGVG